MCHTIASARPSIAILMTCYNRSKTTLKCLRALGLQNNLEDVQTDIYLVDDGCTDGTADAVKLKFPHVRIIKGNGKLYWNGGMRLAWQTAIKSQGVKYDYFFWLNDDTVLLPDAINNILTDYKLCLDITGNAAIICGITVCPTHKCISYGGRLEGHQISPIQPSGKPQLCELINGNAVLVPRSIFNKIGNLSAMYSHGFADFDYSLRAKKQNIKSFVSSGIIGDCHLNKKRHFSAETSIYKRLKSLYSITGSNMIDRYSFSKRHYGQASACILAIKHHIEAIFGVKLKINKAHTSKS